MAGLLDWATQPSDPWSVAARRTRGGVLSDRPEGLTTGLLGALGQVPMNMAGTVKNLMDAAYTHPMGMSVQDNPQYGGLAAETAMNIVGMPALTGGVPMGALGSAARKGSLGQSYRPSLDAQPTPTAPKALMDSSESPRGLSSTDFMQELKARLDAAGLYTYMPPNPNSLSRYLSVGKKSEFHEGVDAAYGVRIRAADHPGYGADYDFRPNEFGRYSQSVDDIVASILKHENLAGLK